MLVPTVAGKRYISNYASNDIALMPGCIALMPGCIVTFKPDHFVTRCPVHLSAKENA